MQTERTFEFILGNVPDASYIYSHSVFIHTNSFNDLKKKFSISAEYFYAKINGYIVKIEHRNHEKLLNIAAMGKIKKVQLKVANEQSLNFEYIPKLSSNFLVQIDFSIEYSATGKYFPEILEEDLEQAIKNYHNEDIINNGDKILVDVSPKNQSIDLKNNKVFLTLTATKIINSDDQIESFGSLLLDTCYEFEVSFKNFKLISSNKKKNIIKKGYNFNDMGVGGMHDEINKIFRTAFVSRMHSNDTLKKFGVKHVKGILLYGPPGTGKTLIAKTLAKMLDSEECTVVNGPELFDKYVGETEKKIRELFVKAEKDEKENGENSGLHVIVFDEIDSICRSRGTISSGTGVHDSAVNQLLTKIDGVESLNNIIIIGMTNRKELIDDAILRPGRLEVHVEIGLPTYKERIEIINIHTKQMRENNLIDDDLNLEEIAKTAENFTGAEIETLVKRAASYAMNTFNIQNLNSGKKTNEVQYSKVTLNHFKYAFEEVKPMFGSDKLVLESSIKFGMINYGKQFSDIQNQLISYVNQLKNSSSANLMSILLHGDTGNGKTSLACNIALNSGFPYVKIISPNQLAKLSETGKAQEIMKIFEDAYKSPLSFVIIDNIERVIEYIKIGPRFSNLILQTLLVYINKAPLNKNHKLMILGTTNVIDRMDDLELVNVFNHKIKLPVLKAPEIKSVLESNLEISENVTKEIFDYFTGTKSSLTIKSLLMTIDETIQLKGKNFSFNDFKEIVELKEMESFY